MGCTANSMAAAKLATSGNSIAHNLQIERGAAARERGEGWEREYENDRCMLICGLHGLCQTQGTHVEVVAAILIVIGW